MSNADRFAARTKNITFAPMSIVLPIPIGRPVDVGGAPTISISAVAFMAMRNAFAGLRKLVDDLARFLPRGFLVPAAFDLFEMLVVERPRPADRTYLGGAGLDRAAAAAHCRCSLSEIDRAAAAGVFKTYKRAGTPLFKKSELDALIERGGWPKRGRLLSILKYQ